LEKIEVIEPEELTRGKSSILPSFLQNNFPHILIPGDCRSTKTFHVEHFPLQLRAILAFHGFSTNVDIYYAENEELTTAVIRIGVLP
jgi:hypothetical protein